MKESSSSSPIIGSEASATFPDSSALSDDKNCASTPPNRSYTGFPKTQGQSLSYWLQQVRCDSLLDHRTTENLPTDADTVVIGSGITGTLVTKNHLETWPEKSVIVLEAREFCSGATGRNAGHCKPDQWRGFGKYEKAYGTEQAIKILDNEYETWDALVKYVREHNVDCDLWVGDTLDVPLDDETATAARENMETFRKAGGKVQNINVTLDPEEAVKKSKLSSAKACYSWKASTLQPWKLTAHIMKENLKTGATLQTYTLATSITEDTSGRRKWIVHTERGDIACDTVVHSTNAYSAALEPSLQGVITPKPHMCYKLIPPRVLSGSKALKNSYGVLLQNGGLFSINPRSSTDGNIMIGGSNPGQKELDRWIEQHPENCINDGLANVGPVSECVGEFVEREFNGWEHATFGPGEGFEHSYSWSGIIGLSADGVPFIGELPEKEGQWICAGHHGHGMARTFTAAAGLVQIMNGEPWSATKLPDVFRLTAERLEKIHRANGEASKVAIV